MQHYFTIEIVNTRNEVRYYRLITRIFKSYRNAEQQFKRYSIMFPNEHLELNSTQWITTYFGFAPIAWTLNKPGELYK